MASSSKGQRAAKRRRKVIRDLDKKQGRRSPIVARHQRGMVKGKKEESNQPVTLYQLALTRGPRHSFYLDSWINSLIQWCDKTEAEADAVIRKASAYANWGGSDPPVLFSCASMFDARSKRLCLESSMMDAVEIIERSTS